MKQKLLKIGKIVVNVLLWVVIAMSLFFAIVAFTTSKDTGVPTIFGKMLLPIATDSMNGDKPDSFKKNALVVASAVEKGADIYEELYEGRIVIYRGEVTSGGVTIESLIAHRIVEVTQESLGANKPYVKVQGDNPQATDIDVVVASNIVGFYDSHVGGIGGLILFLKSGLGFWLLIIIPLALFFGYQVYNVVKISVEARRDGQAELAKEAEATDVLKKAQEEAEEVLRKAREEAERIKQESEAKPKKNKKE